jgi:hypothetical protein
MDRTGSPSGILITRPPRESLWLLRQETTEVCHGLLQDPAFFHFLQRIDEELASEARLGGCRRCSAALHSADYPRKPRGCPASVREEYSSRISFTCGRCQKRTTPASVRFLGRRVYLAVVLMLVSPHGGAAEQALRERLPVAQRTLSRWRRWWSEEFQRTPFWQSVRERFAVVVDITRLPLSLLERFDAGTQGERMTQLLRFVSPLSTRVMIR